MYCKLHWTQYKAWYSCFCMLACQQNHILTGWVAFSLTQLELDTAYLVEEIELLVQWGANLYQSGWVGLRLVGADRSDPDVAQISNIQGAVGGHGQRGGCFQTGIPSIASITWQKKKKKKALIGALKWHNGVSKHTELHKGSPGEWEKSFCKNEDPMMPLSILSVWLRTWTYWDTVASRRSWPKHLDSDLNLVMHC